MKNHFARLLLLSLISLAAQARADSNDEQALMKTVRGFYGWVLKDGKQVSKLQPVIRNIPGGHQFRLDTHNLPVFTEKFIASGYFAPAFSSAVERYYAKYTQQIKAYTAAEFNQMAKDGRGPLMDTEDMDIFFCAQEYEYKKAFVAKMKPKAVKVEGDTASLKVVSPMEWETEFKFVKINQQWLIAGYCVFQ
ncbi:hypothetical protein [Undibacterium sp. TJN19]|uniref:hypothetical protein n=1 Tax=Undibacterium sp. TJN19 TaxID=3413055 RepID=UPI003BF37249